MIGNRSIFGSYTVKNAETGKEFKVIVQADKLYRICNIIYPANASEPQKPDFSKKEAVKAYKEAKLEYDRKVQVTRGKRQAVLNIYKGRQLNDPDIQESLGQFLSNIENA